MNSDLNSEAHFAFKGVSSDHKIVSEKIRPSQNRNKKQTTLYDMTGPQFPMMT